VERTIQRLANKIVSHKDNHVGLNKNTHVRHKKKKPSGVKSRKSKTTQVAYVNVNVKYTKKILIRIFCKLCKFI
jgi:hypothetical protein